MTIQTQYKTVGEINGTNTLRIQTGTDGTSVAMMLVSSHIAGAPVIDSHGRYVGFISEFDLLKAMETGKDLKALQVEEIMTRELQSVSESTSLEAALHLMEEKHLLNLPVVRNGFVTTTLSRHDLLRALLNIGIGIER